MKLPQKALRLVMPLALVSLGSGLLAVAPAVAASASARAPTPSGTGWIRLAHLSPNTPPVDVYLYSFGDPSAQVVLKHVSYGTVSPYEAVTSGTYTVAMRGAGASASSAPVLSSSVTVAAGSAYTVAGMGPASGLRLQVLDDQLTSPPGQALVRVIQASLLEHKVTVTDGSQVLARGLPFATVTGYRAIAPGDQTVNAAGGSNRWAGSVSLSADTIHTLVVLDKSGGLVVVSLEDAAGSHVMPVGGPATGLGGTSGAARLSRAFRGPGSSPAPGSPAAMWLAVLAGGAVLTLAGALRLRRLRGTASRAR
jgi:Domain of unknown function (DUF4397)